MSIYSIYGHSPQIEASAYVHDSATVIGEVTIGESVTVWPGAVLRGDNDSIRIDKCCNIQDGAVIHVDAGHSAHIKEGTSIAHQALIHGATIGSNTLIGMQSVIMNDVVIGNNCIIGANTVITAGKIIPDNSLVVGTPGKIIREVTADEIQSNRNTAAGYVHKCIDYKSGLTRIG